MEPGVARRSAAQVVVMVVLALLLGAVAMFLFGLGVCLPDSPCQTDSAVAEPLAFGGALLGAAFGGGLLAAAVKPRWAAGLSGAAVAAALVAYAITQAN